MWGIADNAADLPQAYTIQANLLSLGKSLFYDKRLSRSGAKSCGSCHDPRLAFTDHYRRGLGLHAEILPRNTPSLINLRYYRTLNWANPDLSRFEAQFEGPLFGQNPPEMGMERSDAALRAALADSGDYPVRFRAAFPRETEHMRWENALKSLAAFVGSLESFDAPYDRFHAGDRTAMSMAAQRGERLFRSARLGCATCHPPPFFTDNRPGAAGKGFHNIGLYNIGGRGDYPAIDQGEYQVTGKLRDKGHFRTPSLRNVSLTAPYMHDGSVETLEDAIRLFEAGGRTITAGEQAGDGRRNPFKSPLIRGFRLSDSERQDLIEFLFALSDPGILINPAFLPDSVPADSKGAGAESNALELSR